MPMTTKPKHAASTETAAGSDRFDVAVLRDLAGGKVFARGVDYHEDGHVEIVRFDEARVLASVEGSEDYRCELVGAGAAFTGVCSCPAFDDWGFCKHLVATALAANSLGPEALEQAAGRLAKIREHLRAKGVEKLVEMIIGIAERDPSLREELELAATVASADDKTLLTEFKKAITDATRTKSYVEYRKVPDWVAEIERVLDRINSLVDHGRGVLVLRLLDHFFARMDDALGSIDDSDGGGSGAYAQACEIHRAACRQVRPDPVALARVLFAREVDSDWEFFRGASEAYEEILGDVGLAEYRRLASEAWQKIKPLRTGRRVEDDQFGKRHALAAILERFAKREGDIDGIIAIRARDLSTAYDYLGIAQLCLDHGREPEALKWAEDGLWQFEDTPDERLILFACDLYRQVGRSADADKLLWRMFERRPSLDLYQRLKAAAGIDGMSADAVRDRVLAWLRAAVGKSGARSGMGWSSPAELLVRVTMEEGLLPEAWAVVKEHGCTENLLGELAEASEQSHPAEVLKVYADRVERMVRLGGSDNYESACRMLGRMRQLREGTGETKQHLAYLYDLMSRHKAKRNFMKLLTAGRA
jgi:uncharacterized Zn finger protein